ncbi:uncharacterized protein [Physcomitrium patens]|uniref:Uncharacterized protein n=1 Tax=Physcomitrium patens TaxID=3218 RepID=A0A2K1IRL6_PHYPA|nr:uncharacterized protein LOC112274018 [Physcomitrium patens]PNR31923.1 hypothetical protein PHYPA_026046 [Physcomitrium patens]|eukprot:XP_024358919.1 uncharacterized protein LOC112274018 [Physcomitrella patens]
METHFGRVATSTQLISELNTWVQMGSSLREVCGSQSLSTSCLGSFSIRLTFSAALPHDFTVGVKSATFNEGPRKYELISSTVNNQIAGTINLKTFYPGLAMATLP